MLELDRSETCSLWPSEKIIVKNDVFNISKHLKDFECHHRNIYIMCMLIISVLIITQ